MNAIQKDSMPGQSREAIADLTGQVERALAQADALGLILVGIDLCSALERLRDIGDAANALAPSDHE